MQNEAVDHWAGACIAVQELSQRAGNEQQQKAHQRFSVPKIINDLQSEAVLRWSEAVQQKKGSTER